VSDLLAAVPALGCGGVVQVAVAIPQTGIQDVIHGDGVVAYDLMGRPGRQGADVLVDAQHVVGDGYVAQGDVAGVGHRQGVLHDIANGAGLKATDQFSFLDQFDAPLGIQLDLGEAGVADVLLAVLRLGAGDVDQVALGHVLLLDGVAAVELSFGARGQFSNDLVDNAQHRVVHLDVFQRDVAGVFDGDGELDLITHRGPLAMGSLGHLQTGQGVQVNLGLSLGGDGITHGRLSGYVHRVAQGAGQVRLLDHVLGLSGIHRVGSVGRQAVHNGVQSQHRIFASRVGQGDVAGVLDGDGVGDGVTHGGLVDIGPLVHLEGRVAGVPVHFNGGCVLNTIACRRLARSGHRVAQGVVVASRNDVLSAAGVQSVFLTRCQFTDIEIVDTQHGIVDGNVAQGHVAGVLDGDGVGDGVTHLVFLLVRRLGDLYGGIVIDIDGPI